MTRRPERRFSRREARVTKDGKEVGQMPRRPERRFSRREAKRMMKCAHHYVISTGSSLVLGICKGCRIPRVFVNESPGGRTATEPNAKFQYLAVRAGILTRDLHRELGISRSRR